MRFASFLSSGFTTKVRFSYQCSDHLSHSKNFTSLFPLIFLSKHISLYALGRIRWILDIIWPLNQHFKLKNQRNWLNQVWMWKFWNVMNCILLHWYKHLTLMRHWFNFGVPGQNGIWTWKKYFCPKNDDEKWSRKNYFEIPPCASCFLINGFTT